MKGIKMALGSLCLVSLVAPLLGSYAGNVVAQMGMMSMGSDEYKVDITFTPDPIVSGAKTTFTFLVFNKTSGAPITGGLVWNHLSAGMGSMMPMLPAPGGVEGSPGKYVVDVVFNRTGDYTFHFHVFPIIHGKRVRMMEPGFGHYDFDIRVLAVKPVDSPPPAEVRPEEKATFDYGSVAAIAAIAMGLAVILLRRKRKIRNVLTLALLGIIVLLVFQILYAPPAPVRVEEKPAVIWIAGGASHPHGEESFNPRVATVILGKNNTVTWRNGDASGHTITESQGRFRSPLINPGKAWTHTLNVPGVYEYFCMPHPWMRGRVIVQPAPI